MLPPLNDLLYRLRSLFRREAVDLEIDEELRFHFENPGRVPYPIRADFGGSQAARGWNSAEWSS